MDKIDINKEKLVIEHYVLAHRLKNLIRTGWKNWNLNSERLESVAEHIYGTQQLAILMAKTYEYDIDLEKVILMLALHETEEIFIGDLTEFEITNEEKSRLGQKAVHDFFKNILNGKEIENLINEFDERKTKEAIFAFQCDKLECDLQAKLYDEEGKMRYDKNGKIDMAYQKNNLTINGKQVNLLLNSNMSWSEIWLESNIKKYNYDINFKKVSTYARNHEISFKQ